MLTCREVTAKSSALLDGELGFRDRMAVRMHLAMCVHCRRFVRQLKVLLESMRMRAGSVSEPVAPEFVERVMRTLDSAHRSEPDDTAGE
jgi:predicted anti-sigma-YlaC factor YlaD